MVYCDHCVTNVHSFLSDSGSVCCNQCGKVLQDCLFSEEATFVKNSAGQSQLAGHYVRTIESEFSSSRQRTIDRVFQEIKYLSYGLGVHDDNMTSQAVAFYR
ncbi:hypothetical protein PIB30_030197 [Stylosanthes scabra]|uniref:TFIIB-type domain-containing protein n=1 Tax=Stylosanthes scabra TaxID=79078 RepID=A0ABU6TDC4_9FABA|nr:hypothetical protein [Stylosanthes scabra]